MLSKREDNEFIPRRGVTFVGALPHSLYPYPYFLFSLPHSPFPVPYSCLPTCGLFRGNLAPYVAWAICASIDPLDVYIYAFGVESCATRRNLLRCARLRPRTGPRMAPRVLVALKVASASLPLPASPLPAPSRRFAGRDPLSAEYRLLASRRAPPRNRRTAPPACRLSSALRHPARFLGSDAERTSRSFLRSAASGGIA